MTLIGTQPIWFEPFGELVIRWFARQGEELRAEIGGTAEAILRAEQRAARVLEYSRLKPMRALKTAREWQTRWEPREAWQQLAAHLDRLGWQALRVRSDDDRRTHLAHHALEETERQVVLVVDHHLRERARTAKDAGCALDLTEDDLAPLVLAEEIYEIESGRLGRPPKPWVDELARPEFAKRLLGWPFHPLVFGLIGG